MEQPVAAVSDRIQPTPTRREWVLAWLTAILFVAATRWPVARLGPIESDEFGYLEIVSKYTLPPHHTLFLALGRAIGQFLGDVYHGFVLLDMATSSMALVAAWWWLRALVSPGRAAAGAFLLACGPIFWSYGSLAGNYTAIVAVGSLLLGVVWRGPNSWNLGVATVALAVGTGYRQDIGTLWLPVYFLMLWQNRWRPALWAVGAFTLLNLLWLGGMLASVGGLEKYRSLTAEFAHSSGYMNSYFNLGFRDGPLRYAIKISMALVGTFGLSLVAVPAGLRRVVQEQPRLAALLLLSIVPALGFHLVIHFGVAGYCMHYVPALLALITLGVAPSGSAPEKAPRRLAGLAAVSAAIFLFYPTNYSPGHKLADFNMAFARHTRIGLRLKLPKEGPQSWRTINSKTGPAQ